MKPTFRCAVCGDPWDSPTDQCLGCGRPAANARTEWKDEFGEPRNQLQR